MYTPSSYVFARKKRERMDETVGEDALPDVVRVLEGRVDMLVMRWYALIRVGV